MSEPLQEKFEIFKTCPEVAKRQSLFKMQPPYKVGRKNSLKDPRRTEHDIMFEIQTHGPVQGKTHIFWEGYKILRNFAAFLENMNFMNI